MDIRLAGRRDGIDVGGERGLRCIFATAHDDYRTRARAEPFASLGWVAKPYTKASLISLKTSDREAELRCRGYRRRASSFLRLSIVSGRALSFTHQAALAASAPIKYPAELTVFMRPAMDQDHPRLSRMSGSTSA